MWFTSNDLIAIKEREGEKERKERETSRGQRRDFKMSIYVPAIFLLIELSLQKKIKASCKNKNSYIINIFAFS